MNNNLLFFPVKCNQGGLEPVPACIGPWTGCYFITAFDHFIFSIRLIVTNKHKKLCLAVSVYSTSPKTHCTLEMVELKKEEKIIIAYTDHCIEKPGAKYKKIKKKVFWQIINQTNRPAEWWNPVQHSYDNINPVIYSLCGGDVAFHRWWCLQLHWCMSMRWKYS